VEARRSARRGAAADLAPAALAALIAIAVLFAWTAAAAVLAPLAIGLAVFVIAGALSDLAERTGLFRVPFATALRARADCRARPGARRSRMPARRRPDRDRLRDHLEQRIYRTMKPGESQRSRATN
jgi:fatty acid desaturase